VWNLSIDGLSLLSEGASGRCNFKLINRHHLQGNGAWLHSITSQLHRSLRLPLLFSPRAGGLRLNFFGVVFLILHVVRVDSFAQNEVHLALNDNLV